MLATYFQRGKH